MTAFKHKRKESNTYRVYVKCLDRLQEWVLHTKTKKKISYKRVWNLVDFEFNLKITHNNKYTTYVIFYLQLTPYFYNTQFQFKNCWVPTVYHVKIHNVCSKCPPPSMHGHVWSQTAATFKSARVVANGLTGIKHVFVKCLFILNLSWTHLGF